MYEPNYAKIQAQQDAEASIMAANLFQLVKEQTRAEIVEKRKDKVKQLGDDIVETIKACFWRGFYNGTQDAKTDIANLSKQKGKKADLASTFSFSNFMTNTLDVIEFEESEEEKLRKEIAAIEKKLGQFRGLSGKSETPLQKQLREKKEQLAQITPVKLIDEFMSREQKINELKADIRRIENNPGYAANVRQMQDEIKGLQRSNAKIRKDVPNIEELATERLMARATEVQPATKTQAPSKSKKQKVTKDDPRVKEIINSPELKAILAKSENDRSRAEQAKLNNAEANLSAIYGKPVSFKGNQIKVEATPKNSGNKQVRKNKYQIERDRLEQDIPEVKGEISINTPEIRRTKKLLQDLLKRNDPKDTVRINDLRKELTSKGIKISVDKFNTVTLQPPEKADQALKRSIYRMEDKRNRERFITLNTEYPSLFDNNPETNSFFQRYLNQRALTIKDGLKKSQEADIKSRVVGFASDTGVSGKGVIELIQKNLAKPEDIAKVNRLRNTVRVKRDRLRFSNAEYLERYENRVATSKTGFTKDELIYINSQRELIKLEEKEEKGGLSSEDLKKLDDQKTAAYRRIDQAEQVIDPDRFDLLDDYAFEGGKTLELDPKKLESLKEKAKNNPKGLANFDRTRRATLTPQEIQQLKATIGEKAYNWAVQKAEVGPNGELRLNSAHLLRLQEKLEQASLNNDTKLMQRATSIATTEISAAYNLGRLQVYLDNGVRYVQYTATLDNKTTVFCQSLHKKIYPLNQLLVQSFTRTFFPITEEPEYSPSNRQYAMREGITFWMPPAHINAYLPNTKVASISPEMLMRKRYKGKAVTFYTEHGNSLSCTIEHPILTTNGFVRAENLKIGDYVFDTFLGDSTVISVPDYKDSIPCVEDLFNLFSVPVSNSIMPIPTLDLDSQVTNNKINIKPFAGNLSKNIIETEIDEVLINPIFESTGEALVSKTCLGTTNEFNQSILPFSAGLISRSYSLPTLFGRIPCAEDLLGLGTFTDTLSVFSQNTFYNTLVYTDFLGHFSHANTQRVKTNKDFNDLLAQSNFSFKPSDMQVKRSKIVNIVVEEYEGFVYHVQDASGINIANGIVAHNCRSFLLPIYTDDVKEKIEENELAKKYKLNVSKEIEKSSINRSLRKGKGKLRAVDDARINDIISKQSRQNEFLTRKSIREVGDFADLFADGYRFIANKLREKGTRFEDGKLILDPEDIKKNDRSLTALLLGSGMVLGFGAMLYFFSKSNLAGALRNYLGIKLGKKAADATAAEVATALGAIDSVINNIPQGLRDQLVDEATPDKPLPDLSKLPKTNDPGGDLLALAKQTQNINDYVAVLNSLSEEELVSLLGASGLTPIERRRIGVQAVVNRINQNINGNIVPQYDAIVKAALGNNKGLAGGLDLKNVRQIQNFSPDALQVKFKPGFGSPTLLSRRRLETALGVVGRKEILEQMRQEVNEEIALLDQWAENLKIDDEQSAIDRALIIKTRKELAEIQAGLEGFANNFEYFRNVDYDALPAETWGDVAAQFGTAARSEVERASVKLYENQIKLDNLANRLRNDFDDLREFDPDIYGKNFFENFNIDSFRQNLIRDARQELDNLQFDPLANQDDINEAREYLRNVINNTANYELPELKDLEFQIQNVISKVNKKYIGKNKPYDLKIAVRRLNDGESEYNTIKQRIDEASNVMRVYGEGENVSPVLSIINKGYADYVQSKYELMLRVQEQIRTRIKELESNNQ